MPNPLQHTVIAAGNLLELLAPVVFIAIYAVIALLNRALSSREKQGPDVEVPKRPHRPADDEAPARPPTRWQRLPYAKGPAGPQPARPAVRARPQPVPQTQPQPQPPPQPSQPGSSRPMELPERFIEAYRRAPRPRRQRRPSGPKPPRAAAPPKSAATATVGRAGRGDDTAGSRAQAPRRASSRAMLKALKQPATVRAAIVYAEVLGPCVALRGGAGFTGPIGW